MEYLSHNSLITVPDFLKGSVTHSREAWPVSSLSRWRSWKPHQETQDEFWWVENSNPSVLKATSPPNLKSTVYLLHCSALGQLFKLTCQMKKCIQIFLCGVDNYWPPLYIVYSWCHRFGQVKAHYMSRGQKQENIPGEKVWSLLVTLLYMLCDLFAFFTLYAFCILDGELLKHCNEAFLYP